MKRFALVGALVAALALAGTAAATQTTQINTTVAGVGCNSDFPCTSGGSETCACRYDDYYFGGEATIKPPLGRLTFTGSFFDIFYASGDREKVLTLTFTASNGQQLVLQGDTRWQSTDPEPPLTWTVNQAQGTGKLAHYTGSGTYTLSHTNIPGGSSEQFTVQLTGTLTFN
jgi:hypothetical protein